MLEVFLLSLLQGATEFLPVSSSGHLVLAENLWGKSGGIGEDIRFVVLVHLGTLLAILIVQRALLLDLVQYALLESWAQMRRDGVLAAWFQHPKGRLVSAISGATVLTAGIGFTGKDFFESLFSQPRMVGWALCGTAILLASTLLKKKEVSLAPSQTEETGWAYPMWIALALGIVQALAIVPGISRSGSTIAVAILLGVRRRMAGEFSFLIAIPAILGALLVQVLSAPGQGIASISLAEGALALVAATLSGWVFLKLLLRFVRGGQFAYFSIYCLIVGVWALLYFPG